MIATAPSPERLFECPHYGRHGFDYWHQDADGRIIAGGFRDFDFDSEFTAEEADDAGPGCARRSSRACRPPARGDASLGGDLRPCPRPPAGRRPRAGEDGVWVAGGYSGHGNVLGFLCGELVAEAILGDPDPLLELFDPARLLVR